MSMAVGGGFRATRMTPPTLGISQIGRAHVCFSDLIWAIGLVVSLAMLREVLKGMNVDGRRWWISSDPHDAADAGYLTDRKSTRLLFGSNLGYRPCSELGHAARGLERNECRWPSVVDFERPA